MLSGIFSPLELNVGIVCMCMPAFRRFVAPILPIFFSARSSLKYRQHQNSDPNNPKPDNPDPNNNDPASPHPDPNAKLSSGKRSDGKGGKKKGTIGASLLETTLKTESTGVDKSGEDEEGLTVEMRRLGEAKKVNKDPRGRYKVNNRHLL